MLKKIATLLVVLTIVSMLFVPVAFAAETDFVYLDISENKTVYIDEDAKGVPFKVYAVQENGTKVDVSDSINYPYTIAHDGSQDNTVFYIKDKKLWSTGRNGKVVIRLSYKATNSTGETTLAADLVFFRQSSTTLAGQPIAVDSPDYLDNATTAAYITSGTPGTADGGHFDGSAYSNWPNNWTVRLVRKGYATNGSTTATKYEEGTTVASTGITGRWWDSGYRGAQVWFYDDGVAEHSPGLATLTFCDSVLFHQVSGSLAEDYGYTPELKAKWEGMNSWEAFIGKNLIANKDGEYKGGTYFHNKVGMSAYWGIAKRRVGWHQFAMTLEKDPSAEYGWSIYSYLDGKNFAVWNIKPSTAMVPAGATDAHSWATIEIRPNYSSAFNNYLDDTVLLGYVEAPDLSKTLTGAIGEGGTVTVNGSALANGATVKIDEGTDVTVAVTPNAGYNVGEVKVGDNVITLNASNEATFTMPAANSTLTVTFSAKATTPSVGVPNPENNYFKTVDGVATAIVYGKLGDFYDPACADGYGMNLWIEGAPENKLQLAAMADASTAAVAAPNAAFAIKVFGDAITSANNYVFQPYVGSTLGSEVVLTFTE